MIEEKRFRLKIIGSHGWAHPWVQGFRQSSFDKRPTSISWHRSQWAGLLITRQPWDPLTKGDQLQRTIKMNIDPRQCEVAVDTRFDNRFDLNGPPGIKLFSSATITNWVDDLGVWVVLGVSVMGIWEFWVVVWYTLRLKKTTRFWMTNFAFES